MTAGSQEELTDVQLPTTESALPPPGAYPGVRDRVYRAWPAVSRSDLRPLFRGQPYSRVLWEREHPRSADDSQIRGRALHALVLEGAEIYRRDYYSVAKMDRRTTEGKKAWKDALQEAGERALLPEADAADVRGMADSLYANPWMRDLLYHPATQTELSVCWAEDLSEYGINEPVSCKCRLDAANLEQGIIADIKSCPDASPDGFGGFFTQKAWLYQAAWYAAGTAQVTGLDSLNFYVLAVEDHPPYDCTAYPVPAELMQSAWQQLLFWLAGYARCEQHGVWPGYEAVQDVLRVRSYQVRALLEG